MVSKIANARQALGILATFKGSDPSLKPLLLSVSLLFDIVRAYACSACPTMTSSPLPHRPLTAGLTHRSAGTTTVPTSGAEDHPTIKVFLSRSVRLRPV